LKKQGEKLRVWLKRKYHRRDIKVTNISIDPAELFDSDFSSAG
jgi:hypothetical protein